MFNKAMGSLAALANEDQFFDRMLDRHESDAERREQEEADHVYYKAIDLKGEYYPWSVENLVERMNNIAESDTELLIFIAECGQSGDWDEWAIHMRKFFTDYAEKMALIDFEKGK